VNRQPNPCGNRRVHRLRTSRTAASESTGAILPLPSRERVGVRGPVAGAVQTPFCALPVWHALSGSEGCGERLGAQHPCPPPLASQDSTLPMTYGRDTDGARHAIATPFLASGRATRPAVGRLTARFAPSHTDTDPRSFRACAFFETLEAFRSTARGCPPPRATPGRRRAKQTNLKGFRRKAALHNPLTVARSRTTATQVCQSRRAGIGRRPDSGRSLAACAEAANPRPGEQCQLPLSAKSQ
jgi:hypothetical protein